MRAAWNIVRASKYVNKLVSAEILGLALMPSSWWPWMYMCNYHALTAIPWIEQDDHISLRLEAVLSVGLQIHYLRNHFILSHRSIHWDGHLHVHWLVMLGLHRATPLPITHSPSVNNALKTTVVEEPRLHSSTEFNIQSMSLLVILFWKEDPDCKSKPMS